MLHVRQHCILLLCRELGEWRTFRSSRIAVEGAETAAVRVERRGESAAQRAVDVMRRAGLASTRPVLVSWDQAGNHRLDSGCFDGSERLQRLARKRHCLGGKRRLHRRSDLRGRDKRLSRHSSRRDAHDSHTFQELATGKSDPFVIRFVRHRSLSIRSCSRSQFQELTELLHKCADVFAGDREAHFQ